VRAGWTDQQLERAIGALLRAGVLLSAALVLLGEVVQLVGHAGQRGAFPPPLAQQAGLRLVEGVLRRALGLEGAGLIQLGLLVLVATPVARVALCVLGYATQRDGTYLAITLAVLVILCVSLFWVRL